MNEKNQLLEIDFQSLKERIREDMQEQADRRTRPFNKIILPFVLTAAIHLVLVVLMLRGQHTLSLSQWALFIGYTLLWASIIASPFRPKLGSQLAPASIFLMLLAGGMEFFRFFQMPFDGHHDLGVKCGLHALGVSAISFPMLYLTMRATRFPWRRVHYAALASMGIAFGMTSVWFGCPGHSYIHIGIGHVLIPFLFIVALGILLWRTRTLTRLSPARELELD